MGERVNDGVQRIILETGCGYYDSIAELTAEELEKIRKATVDIPHQGFHLEIDVNLLTWKQRAWLTVGLLDESIDDGLWLEVWNFLSERANDTRTAT